MAFIDSIFRRVSHPGDASPCDQVNSQASAPRKISAPAKRKKHSGGGFYYWNFFIHKWAGLIGAAWLAALGLTGFFLDHDSWRWLMQSKSPAFLTPASLDANSARGVTRYQQIDPSDRATMAKLAVPGYHARIERGFVISVEAFDWNCSQHITPRFTLAQLETLKTPPND